MSPSSPPDPSAAGQGLQVGSPGERPRSGGLSPAQLRQLMPALANKTYFNYGGQGPLPAPSLAAITECWQNIQTLGPFTGAVWPFLADLVGGVRGDLAAICGVSPHRLALTENVSSGCVLPLWGLPWQEGDELLVGDCEHPGVVAACRELAQREGLRLGTLAVKAIRSGSQDATDRAVLDALEQALRPQTRLVVLSHLLWNTGLVMPIPAVARRLREHRRHPWLLVDAAQSVGSLPVAEAATAADIYAFTGHKWCCGPEGLGGVALSERLLSDSRPTMGGWRSLANENEAGPWHLDARRFEVATSCAPLMAGLRCSLALLGAVADESHRLELICARSHQLWYGLQEIRGLRTLLGQPPTAGLVSVALEGDDQGLESTRLVETLGQRGLWVRSLDDPTCLRACTHLTTTAEEVEQLLAALRSFLG